MKQPQVEISNSVEELFFVIAPPPHIKSDVSVLKDDVQYLIGREFEGRYSTAHISLFKFDDKRHFDEIIRVLDSMQLTAKHKVATPANWKQGEDVIITGAVSNEDADKIFPGYRTVKPYLRTVAQPK